VSDLTEENLMRLMEEWCESRAQPLLHDGYDHHVTAWRGWRFLQALADTWWPAKEA